MTTNEKNVDARIAELRTTSEQATAEAVAADLLNREGTLDADEALRRHNDFIIKSQRKCFLDRQLAALTGDQQDDGVKRTMTSKKGG